MNRTKPGAFSGIEDPFALLSHLLNKANTEWLRLTYPFAGFGKGVSIHRTCDIYKQHARHIQIGDRVYLDDDVWLNAWGEGADGAPTLILGNGCAVGRRCMITAKNQICLEDNVLMGPSILIADHSHEFSNVETPIVAQGLTPGGTIRIERNCWIGYGAAIVCSSGHLVIGQNSVVGACAVVTRSVPPFTAVAGNPARIVKRYDPVSNRWVKPPGSSGSVHSVGRPPALGECRTPAEPESSKL